MVFLHQHSARNPSYGKRTTAKIVEYLLEELNNGTVKYNDLIEDIGAQYRSMFPPRGGLSEFHIWDENYEIRHRANHEYEQLKEQIDEILEAD